MVSSSSDVQPSYQQPLPKTVSHVLVENMTASKPQELPTNPRNDWTYEQQRALCFMVRIYNNPWPEITSIFNKWFHRELSTINLVDGMTKERLQSYFNSMKDGSINHLLWTELFKQTTIGELRRKFPEIKEHIEEIALKLKIELKLRVTDDRAWTKSGYRVGKTCRKICHEQVVLPNPTPIDSESDEAIKPRRKRTRLGSRSHNSNRTPKQLLTPTSSRGPALSRWKTVFPIIRVKTDGDVSRTRPIPEVLFRFTNPESMGVNESSLFKAGLFRSSGVTVPGAMDENVFRAAVITHFNRQQEYTPFISTFDWLRPALHRALGSESPAYITIFDPKKASAAFRRKFGNDTGYIYSAQDLIKKYDLRTKLPNRYWGSAEWLVFGEIQKEAIVGGFSIAAFHEHVSSNPSLRDIFELQYEEGNVLACGVKYQKKLKYGNQSFGTRRLGGMSLYEIGQSIGRFLGAMSIPNEYLSLIAGIISMKWDLGDPPDDRYLAGVLGTPQLLSSPQDTFGREANVEDAQLGFNDKYEDEDDEDGEFEIHSDDDKSIGDFIEVGRPLKLNNAFSASGSQEDPSRKPESVFGGTTSDLESNAEKWIWASPMLPLGHPGHIIPEPPLTRQLLRNAAEGSPTRFSTTQRSKLLVMRPMVIRPRSVRPPKKEPSRPQDIADTDKVRIDQTMKEDENIVDLMGKEDESDEGITL